MHSSIIQIPTFPVDSSIKNTPIDTHSLQCSGAQSFDNMHVQIHLQIYLLWLHLLSKILDITLMSIHKWVVEWVSVQIKQNCQELLIAKIELWVQYTILSGFFCICLHFFP